MNDLEKILTVLGLVYLIERVLELRRRGSRRSSDLARMLTLDRERNRRS